MIRTNKKLEFYSIFKNETNYSEFINHIRNPEHRRVASKFRIRNHNLKIETGRFTITKTPQDLRICDHFNLKSVENDELHILFHCDLYNQGDPERQYSSKPLEHSTVKRILVFKR